MAYRVSWEGPTLMITLWGTMESSDLQGFASEVLAIEDDGRNSPHRITDLRGVEEAAVGYQDMARLAGRTRLRPVSRPIKSAIVIAQPVQLGYARMFQILNDHPFVTVRIFEDEADARAWVEADDADVSGTVD